MAVLWACIIGERISPEVRFEIAVIVIGFVGVGYTERSVNVNRKDRLGSTLAVIEGE